MSELMQTERVIAAAQLQTVLAGFLRLPDVKCVNGVEEALSSSEGAQPAGGRKNSLDPRWWTGAWQLAFSLLNLVFLS